MGVKEEEGASQAEAMGKGQLVQTCSGTANYWSMAEAKRKMAIQSAKEVRLTQTKTSLGRKGRRPVFQANSQRLALELDGDSRDAEERACRITEQRSGGADRLGDPRRGRAPDAPFTLSPQVGSAWT